MPRWLSPAKQKVLKALLKGSVLLPYHAVAETALSNSSTFRFGAAYSAKPHLSTAVVDCVNAIRKQLGPGRHPHFCQLLVTAEAHGSHIEFAPSVKLLWTCHPPVCVACIFVGQCEEPSSFCCIVRAGVSQQQGGCAPCCHWRCSAGSPDTQVQ